MRPNILLFLMDACQAAAVESPECHTPNFDRLAERGLVFDRTYCPSPTCSPSRASLMTGLLPHNHGVLEVEHGRDPDQCVLRDFPHWAQRLREAGYETGYFGKWHIERSHDLSRYGWERFHAKGAGHHAGLGKGEEPSAQTDDLLPEPIRYHTGPEGYADILHYAVSASPMAERYPHFTVTQALEFLEETGKARDESKDESDSSDESRSWCLCASFSEPNEALIASEEVFRDYDPQAISLPENLRDPFENKPGLYRREARIGASLSDQEWRLARTCYYARITEVDAQFGRLVDQLERDGTLESTVLVVTADHGRYVGGHGFDAHNIGPFEEIYRVPLILAGPGIAEGERRSGPVGLHDLGPTLLDLADAEPLAADLPDSISFSSALARGGSTPRRGAYAEYHGTRFPLAQRIWWQGDWKFVFNGFDFDELYHLAEDPGELRNLAHDPSQEERMRAMMREVWREIRETGDRTLEETHYFSMRLGIVGPLSKG